MKLKNPIIGIIGLGYVGLPLAVEFGKIIKTIGFDINSARIAELQLGQDSTLEVEPIELTSAQHLSFTKNIDDLKACTIFIITVPTPIDNHNNPDLTPLIKASHSVGKILNPNTIVIYESTVYPGATEEVCVPILEKQSGMVFNKDFFVGYSPERINPGDKQHRLPSITKVTSGSTPAIAETIDQLYRRIITAGTHKASSIKVAEAAKVIENTQRDINIALINELALIFERLDINTEDVLNAAGSKWNFLPFRPGLVGGHCIGVDPYYLTHKATEVGYNPEIILAGRRLNDQMGSYVADQVVKLMTQKRIHVVDSKILIMGLAFKENCPDLRNTRVIDVYERLNSYHCQIDIYDPWANAKEAQQEYGIKLLSEPQIATYDAIILAVAHNEFKALSSQDLRKLTLPNHVIYDIKYILPADEVDGRL